MIKYFNKSVIMKNVLLGIFVLMFPLLGIGMLSTKDILIMISVFVMGISLSLWLLLKILIDDAEKELSAISNNIRELEAEIRKINKN